MAVFSYNKFILGKYSQPTIDSELKVYNLVGNFGLISWLFYFVAIKWTELQALRH